MGRTLTSDLIVRLHDRSSGPARGIESSLGRLENRQRRFGRNFERNGNRVARRMAAGTAGVETAMLARAAAIAAPAAAAYAGARAYGDFAAAEREMTRTGLKLGADRQTMREIRQEMELIANKYAVPIQEVMASFDSLAESGFELDEARQSLDGVVKATQGLGGSGQDTVNSFDAARKSIGLAAEESERFFDIIAAGGSSGKFEGSDLARYLPSLLPVVARQGYKGLEGAAKLVGFLEVMRDFVGSSEEAATATQDIFEKISSPDVIKKFSKLGVDLEKELKDARDAGKDVLWVLSDIINEVTKGDATKLSQIFGDRDSRRAANVLMTQMDRVKRAQRDLLANSGGTIRHNVEIVTEDAQAKIDKMSNSWERFKKSVGAGIAVGATPALDAITNAMDRGQAYQTGIAKEEARGGSKSEARAEFDRRYDEVNPDFDWWNPGDQQARSRAFVDSMEAYGRGDAATPYADLDRTLEGRRGGRFPDLAESRKRADAWARQQAEANRGNIDVGPVRRGIPEPRSRPGEAGGLSQAEQYREYGRGRRRGEEKGLIQLSADPVVSESISRIEAVQARIAAAANGRSTREPGRTVLPDLTYPASEPAIAQRAAPVPTRRPSPAEAAVGIKPAPIEVPVTPKADTTAIDAAIREIDQRLGELYRTAGQVRGGFDLAPTSGATTNMKAIADEMDELMRRRQELESEMARPMTSVAPDINGPLTIEGNRATATAQATGTAMQTALSVRAKPTIDTSDMDVAIRKADILVAKLQSIPGHAARAGQASVQATAKDVGREMGEQAGLRHAFSDNF